MAENHESISPSLARIAKKVFSVPVSSSTSERTFSSSGLVLNAKKTRMAPKKIESSVLLRINKDRITNFKEKSGYCFQSPEENMFLEGNNRDEHEGANFDDDLHYDM